MTGKVWLVGAGPGDRGLFTLKGLEVLQNAEVVVHDALIGDEVLTLIPENAVKINVGKRASHHRMEQDQINRTLLEQAQAGKRVVRLKGGDPFLFGRGGEELELLAENNIPFEVVPGVTSAFRKARMSPQTNTLPPEPGPGRLQKRAEAPGLQPEQLQKRAEAPGLQPGRLKRRSEAPVRDRVMRTVWGSTMKPWSAHTAH